ncbi:MAG: hypothetical protein MJE68_00190, partial [Proteobacteria bacterium]|nr:hypothetical protein [Pseudomonadota bacterium]
MHTIFVSIVTARFFVTMQVKCYTLDGFIEGTKFTLRCKHCSLTYNYAQFGKKNEDGFRFYPQPRRFIEVSDTVFFSREMLELQCSLA